MKFRRCACTRGRLKDPFDEVKLLPFGSWPASLAANRAFHMALRSAGVGTCPCTIELEFSPGAWCTFTVSREITGLGNGSREREFKVRKKSKTECSFRCLCTVVAYTRSRVLFCVASKYQLIEYKALGCKNNILCNGLIHNDCDVLCRAPSRKENFNGVWQFCRKALTHSGSTF